jgi:hypothetical protein
VSDGYVPVADNVFDVALKILSPPELKIFMFIYRKTLGYRKIWDRISVTQFEDGTKLSHATIHRSTKVLCGMGLVVCKQFVPEGALPYNEYRLGFSARLLSEIDQSQKDTSLRKILVSEINQLLLEKQAIKSVDTSIEVQTSLRKILVSQLATQETIKINNNGDVTTGSNTPSQGIGWERSKEGIVGLTNRKCGSMWQPQTDQHREWLSEILDYPRDLVEENFDKALKAKPGLKPPGVLKYLLTMLWNSDSKRNATTEAPKPQLSRAKEEQLTDQLKQLSVKRRHILDKSAEDHGGLEQKRAAYNTIMTERDAVNMQLGVVAEPRQTIDE